MNNVNYNSNHSNTQSMSMYLGMYFKNILWKKLYYSTATFRAVVHDSSGLYVIQNNMTKL